MRASLIVLLTAGTAATTNPAAQRAVRYRGGETAHKKTLDEFLRHLGGGELEAVWEKAPKLWRRVDGCVRPRTLITTTYAYSVERR